MSNQTTQTALRKRRRLTGVVVSVKMAKTVVVRIDRRIPHPLYGKYHTVSKQLKAHDPLSAAKLGDIIEIEETRPVSKDKRWRYITTVSSVLSE